MTGAGEAWQPLTELLPMTSQDLEAVSALEASLQAFPWTLRHFADSLTAGHRCRILRQGSDLLGFSVAMIVLDEAHLLTIGVRQASQGQGMGARLLRDVMSGVREQGAERLFLEVRPSNATAVALYRHFGFREIGVRKGYYPAREGREDALIFDKGLA